MKQPQLGRKINEIRNKSGITQKELSESCHIDIRTVQRIESGEVVPRMFTLKLLARALECDPGIFYGNGQNQDRVHLSKILNFSLVAGMVYFLNWILYSRIIVWNLLQSNSFLLSIIHFVSGALFYFGFYMIGKHQRNSFLKIGSLIIMICIPLFVISNLTFNTYNLDFSMQLSRLSVIILGVNGFIFGIGLLKTESQLNELHKVSGVLQILISPLFIVPIPIAQMVGLWLTVPFILLMLIIISFERSNRQLLAQ